MARNIFLEMKHVNKTFPGVKALSDISFNIEYGEVHALVGENGAGKSTLIKVLSGVFKPDKGSELYIKDEQVHDLDPITSVKNGIAVTFQDLSLFPNLSVVENISISGSIEEGRQMLSWKDMRATARKTVERLGVKIDISARLGSLSTAKQQLVAIARALVHDARLIILDEPTASLSSKEVETLYTIIETLKKANIAVLFISHKLEEVFKVADRITVLRDGECMGTYTKEELDDKKLISLMVGRTVEFLRKPHGGLQEENILEIKNLNKKGNYKDINISLKKGEILGITGLVGAGRTEVMQSLFGVNKPDSGEIYLDGKKVTINRTEDAVNYGIAMVPESRQEEGLILRKSVAENVVLSVLKNFVNKLNMIDNKQINQTAVEWINKLKIKPGYPNMPTEKLSGGNQQRVVIAKWLLAKPQILIIDEPTNGIDVGAKEEIHDILRDLAKQGIGIIMISSELPEVLAVSDRILVMRRGRIVAEIEGGKATQEDIMSKAL